jgi:DNA ligase-1
MTSKFKPMLAAQFDEAYTKFPCFVSPKLDGVRATSVNGELLTRSLKKIPNRAVARRFNIDAPLDGELIVGDPNSPTVFRDTMKTVMSFEADITDLKFFAFDLVTPGRFVERLQATRALCEEATNAGGDHFIYVPHRLVHTMDEILQAEEEALNQGFEGVMLRDPNGKYKFGRSTTAEAALVKLKRFNQSEAVIIGFEEQMHNANEAKVDNLGHTERSSHKANMVPTGMLGAMVVRDLNTNIEFNVGTGFTAADRQEYWTKRESLVGKVVSYKFLAIGVKDKPRHPVFLGFRNKEDL